ncbi:arylsulfatase [Gaoshiqia sediminis]|uniref:Arylsulfatase n=1 Tax=Gaoshiqia sediminis TaxID=2986998 RepID=A0AA42CAZ6_9BACT|nr:arylsulfatase [Gaoshiqia sediminis]MCW0484517.1 arylsulfatase [Gaoshiqia sediminis]
MNKISLLTLATTLTLSVSASEKPNIILIMSDDMGFSDLGCYGGEIQTPNLDKLATNGVRFTQFYNTARCCPTRASLMTGLYPHQTGIGHMTNDPENPKAFDIGLPGYRGFLNRNCVTIAEVLKEAGYSTLMTGKWHLGMHEKNQWPLQRGFDQFYGILAGASNYFEPRYPRGITSGNDTISVNDPDYYTTDAFTDHAISFIRDANSKNPEKPFFLYLAYNAPHWPLNAPTEDIDKYRGRYKDGWQAIREERYIRMIELGIIDSSWTLSPQDSRSWDSLPEEKRKEMALRMEIYAAQVDRMDQNIGRLIDYLEKNNLMDNTIIVFIDDNGACAEGGELGGGPVRQLETRQGYFLTYGQAWANASNTPFKRYKHWIHEGGISSPMIVHWPNGIKENDQGKFIRQYGFLPDIMATFVDLAGTQYPEKYDGNDIRPLEGKSLVPLFKGSEKPVHTEPVFWEHEGNKAVRMGKYKLVMAWNNQNPDKWELYDLETDRTEMNDLSEQFPDKVYEMKRMWNEWAQRVQVEPWSKVLELERKQNKK